MAAELEVRLDSLVQRLQPSLLQTVGQPPSADLTGDVGEGRAAPHPQGSRQKFRPFSRARRVLRRRHQPPKPVHIDSFGIGLQHVAAPSLVILAVPGRNDRRRLTWVRNAAAAAGDGLPSHNRFTNRSAGTLRPCSIARIASRQRSRRRGIAIRRSPTHTSRGPSKRTSTLPKLNAPSPAVTAGDKSHPSAAASPVGQCRPAGPRKSHDSSQPSSPTCTR